MPSLESRTLHFDLSCYKPDTEFTLLAGKGRKYKLKSYANYPEKMAEHRACNRALARIPDNRISHITHFVEGAELDAERSSMRRVVFPSLDDHPLPEIAMAFFHVPHKHVREAYHRGRAYGKAVPHPLALNAYGVSLQASELEDEELHADAADVKPPGVTAQAIVMQHPELGTGNPVLIQYVVTHYVSQGQAFSALVQYIQNNGPGTNNQWYNKSWAQWSQNEDGSGPMVPAAVNTDLKFSDGKTPDWPTPPGASAPGMPAYNLTDEYDPPSGSGSGTGVIGAASSCVQQTLILTKNDASLNGLLWSRQSGVTQKEQSNVSPSNNVAAARASAQAAFGASGAGGFGLKNITSSYGLYIYDNQMAWDFNTKTLSVPVKNWPSRYLGAYVQFQQEDGTIINRADITAVNPADPNKPFTWQDPLPDIGFIREAAEPSPSKNYLTWLSAGNAVFGVPVPPLTQQTTLSFLWPDNASKGVILLGGLGVASGFTDWDSDVDLIGVLGTGLVCYGVGTAVLLLNVYVINPFLKSLEGDGAIAFYAVAGVIGATALVLGVAFRDSSFGKMILSKLAGLAASFIFGQVATRLITAGAVKYATVLAESAGELTGEITAEEALEEVPVAGWALRVVSIASDVAGLAATTIECLASPATYQLEILRTMDLTVTVGPDPTHGKKGFKPVWPLVSDHYVIQVKYPSANNSDGGTTYTKSGPMPAAHDQPITVTFSGIPAGGKIDVSGNIYSATNWLAGRWDSGWINATPDSSDQLSVSGNIVELLVPLTANTTYSQKQTLAYSGANQHFWQVTQFGLDSSLMPGLNTAGSPSVALRAAFAANGNTLSSAATVTVNTPSSQWTLNDPTSGNVFAINLRLISSVPVFQISNSFVSTLNAGGATPSSISGQFDNNQQPLPSGTVITVVTSGSQWTIGLAGQPAIFSLTLSGANINVVNTQFELTVQNTANAAPPLPAVYPLPAGPTGNQLGALQNIIINDNEFELGYAWMASGQNLPLDNGTSPVNVPMYTMQSISTLGQPQEQIIEPTRGFSLPSFIAYDQFGLTPVFPLPSSVITELNNGGAVPSDIAQEFTAFGATLPSGAQITVVTASKDWTIGVAGQDPLYELRVMNVLVNGQSTTQVGVFAWPIPAMDNFYLDTRFHSASDPTYYIRGVNLDVPGASTFDYDSTLAWGRIVDPGTIQGLAVHPQGYIVAVDFANHKLFTLKLPAQALPSDQAPLALPLSGQGILEGLMLNPVALTITSDGRILVLEEGNQRVQAFDIKGNPVPCFAVQPAKPFQIPGTFASELDNQTISTALVQTWQQNVVPAQAAKFMISSPTAVVTDLNSGTVDATLLAAFVQNAYADQKAVSSDFTVQQNVPGQYWLVTNTKTSAEFDVRVMADQYGINHLYVFTSFALNVTIVSQGSNWLINDTTNAMSFQVSKPATGSTLSVQQVVSYMPLRDQGIQGISYLDIATETKGYIYVLSVIQSGQQPTFQLDIYNPDGTVLLTQAQTGVNAGKLTVDQYRSMFTLNFNVVLGPGGRTEPGVSEWAPSTPTPAS